MTPRRLGLIGFGAIGRAVTAMLPPEEAPVAILVPTPRGEGGLPFCTGLDEFLAHRPEVVIEAAGHAAVRAHVPALMDAGVEVVISSIGALAFADCRAAVVGAASRGARAILSAGAVAGLDGLAAARLAGLRAVTYTSLKPPDAWRGTPAEALVDLDAIEDEALLFEGSAAEAASGYPKNANVSAAIAFAGLGLERTRVRLVASRRVPEPLGLIEAEGDFGWFRFEIFAAAFPENPKSSRLTASALLQSARLGIGLPVPAIFGP